MSGPGLTEWSIIIKGPFAWGSLLSDIESAILIQTLDLVI